MKTAMKKIFSLMLVAVLLVSAVPFAASASETYSLKIYVNSELKVETAGTATSYDECVAALAAHGITHATHNITVKGCSYTANGGEHAVSNFVPGGGVVTLYGPTTVHFEVQKNGTEPDAPAAGNPSTPDVSTVAYLEIYENGVQKGASIQGTPYSNVNVADCVTAGNINSANITKIETSDGQAVTLNGSFVLGAPDSVTKIMFTTVVPPVTPTAYTISYNLNYNNHQDVVAATAVAGTSMGAVLNQIPQPSRNYFYFSGWCYDAAGTLPVKNEDPITASRTIYAKWTQIQKFETILKIYTNGNTNSVVKVVDIFEYGQDGKVTLDEVKTVVANNIKANTNAGLFLYGPFNGSEWDQYCLNNRYKNNEYVNIDHNTNNTVYVMVHNAQIKGNTSTSGTKADSTNPKTGDMIFAPVAVMGLSVSTLAVLFYLNKKRAI